MRHNITPRMFMDMYYVFDEWVLPRDHSQKNSQDTT